MRPHHAQRPESRSHAHQETYKKPLSYRSFRIAVVMPIVSPLEHFHCSTFFDSLLALLPEERRRKGLVSRIHAIITNLSMFSSVGGC